MKRKGIDASAEQLLHLRNIKIIEQIGNNVKRLINAVVIILLAYWFFDAVKAYAGKESYADVNVIFNLLAKIEAKIWVPYVVGISSFIYGIREMKLRKKKTKYLSSRITKLEKLLDENRSSSGLNHFGETNEGD